MPWNLLAAVVDAGGSRFVGVRKLMEAGLCPPASSSPAVPWTDFGFLGFSARRQSARGAWERVFLRFFGRSRRSEGLGAGENRVMGGLGRRTLVGAPPFGPRRGFRKPRSQKSGRKNGGNSPENLEVKDLAAKAATICRRSAAEEFSAGHSGRRRFRRVARGVLQSRTGCGRLRAVCDGLGAGAISLASSPAHRSFLAEWCAIPATIGWRPP